LLAEHHVAGAGKAQGIISADDHVGEPVAVDVAGRGDRAAGAIVGCAAEREAVAAVEARQVDVGGEAGLPAEHHIAGAGFDSVRVGPELTDDQVGEAVAVDVACRGH